MNEIAGLEFEAAVQHFKITKLFAVKRMILTAASHPRQDLSQGLFFIAAVLGKRKIETRVLLNYVGHRLTGCTVSQVTQLELGFTECNESPALMPAFAWTKPKGQLLCYVCQWFFAHPKLGTIEPRIYHSSWYPNRHDCRTAQQEKPGKFAGKYTFFSKLGYDPIYPPSYGLNSTTTVLLGEWLWH